MFEFGAYSLELFEPGRSSVCIDYESFECAEDRAKRFLRCPDKMVTIIEWDASKRWPIREWLVLQHQRAIPFLPSATLH